MSKMETVDINDGELQEKVEFLLILAEEYIRQVGGKFVFKYVAAYPNLQDSDWVKRQQTYCYEFRLPNNIKLSVITNFHGQLEYHVWYNYTKVASERIVERTIDMVVEYLSMRVDAALNTVLDSVADILKKDINRRKL